MKKFLIGLVIIIAIMMAAKNPQFRQFLEEKPLDFIHWVQSRVQGVTDYKPEEFAARLDAHQLPLSKREQRYVRNIGKSSSDLLLFYKRYCRDLETSHLVLDDPNLLTVCQVTRQTLLLE